MLIKVRLRLSGAHGHEDKQRMFILTDSLGDNLPKILGKHWARVDCPREVVGYQTVPIVLSCLQGQNIQVNCYC